MSRKIYMAIDYRHDNGKMRSLAVEISPSYNFKKVIDENEIKTFEKVRFDMNTDAYYSRLAEEFYTENNFIKFLDVESTAELISETVYDEFEVEISEKEANKIAEKIAEAWDEESETAKFEFKGRILETPLWFDEYDPAENDGDDFTYGSEE